ncbi:MAG TPA: ABC transporter permease [Ktedonobacterales bacterium]|jgi:ABC-2 type transport system permease protein|nr:ABC transporter permease [Ktedonobacterales bacterium]
MPTILSLYVANMKEFIRDRAALFWTFAFPIVFIVMFGAIFSGGGSHTYSVGLVNQDGGPVGAELASAFQHRIKAFDVKIGSYDDELSALKKGNLDLVIVLPAGLSQTVASGHTAQVQMYFDPSKNAVNAQIEQNIVAQTLEVYNRSVTKTTPALSLAMNTITSQSLSEIDFLMPGILAMSLMQLGLFATATPLVSLRAEGVLRRLGATPLPRWQLIAGQLLMRLTIGLAQAALIIGLSVAMFHVHIQGSYVTLAGLTVLGALTFIGMGYLIAALAKSVESASGISSAINFPMMFLSGVFFPVALLPAFLAPVVKALPLTYLADAFRQVTVGGAPDFPMWVDVAVLAGWGVVCMALAARFFKWE